MRTILIVAGVILQLVGYFGRCPAEDLLRIVVSDDRKGFQTVPDGKPFRPWGFNYDRDDAGRLLEDYWETEWSTVRQDFEEMRELGANAVRVHLQLGKFMESADRPREASIAQLRKLLDLAEEKRLYLNLTGLGCYHKGDVPAWYDALSESDRWAVQARFWQAIARTCSNRAVVFCFDLMNEPVAPAGQQPATDWLGPAFAGKHFVQRIALSQNGRPRPEIARAWIRQMVTAIREVDSQHLITVGLVDWSLDRPGLTSGFVPREVAEDLDFLCVHLYPKQGKVEEALVTLSQFSIGKPVVIEETFPLMCSLPEFEQFLTLSARDSAGLFGFYWGKPISELQDSTAMPDQLVRAWLEWFVKQKEERKAAP